VIQKVQVLRYGAGTKSTDRTIYFLEGEESISEFQGEKNLRFGAKKCHTVYVFFPP
jgi:hypothetical protein